MLFWWNQFLPPFFPQREHDYENRISDLSLSMVSCAFSHCKSNGLAHSRVLLHQKWLEKQLIFNSFVLWLIIRNITCISVAGFSLIFDKAFFYMQVKASNFHENFHVTILLCFAMLFWWFCFGICTPMLLQHEFLEFTCTARWCFKTVLCRKWQCA